MNHDAACYYATVRLLVLSQVLLASGHLLREGWLSLAALTAFLGAVGGLFCNLAESRKRRQAIRELDA